MPGRIPLALVTILLVVPPVRGNSEQENTTARAVRAVRAVVTTPVAARPPFVPEPPTPELILRNRIRFWMSSSLLLVLILGCLLYRRQVERTRAEAARRRRERSATEPESSGRRAA